MRAENTPSVRRIAAVVGLSKATVANALAGSASVAPATKEKVHAAAAKLGYKRNPMIGALMSALRRSQGTGFQGVIAVAEIIEPDRPRHGPFHDQLVAGCTARANELGFKIEFHQITPKGLSPERLSGILKARGIRGLVLLPSWRAPDFARFDWSYLTGVYTDYVSENPVLNCVCCDHYRTTYELLQLLHARGYRRPGLMLETGRDDRLHHRTSAALRAFQAAVHDTDPIEPHFAPEVNKPAFTRWFKQERPDVVLGHETDMLDWIRAAGPRVPGDVGFVALNQAKSRHPCAALNLHADEIGRCAVEVLISQVQRQAWGMPRFPTTTTLTGAFVDGVTVRRSGMA